jgi:anti-sigma B factor antagonist
MTIAERRLGDVTLLVLSGRLVYNEGDVILRARINDLLSQGRVKIVIDLQNVTALDSCGVGELVARFVSARQKRGDVKLLHLSRRSHRVIEISKLLDVFQTFDSEADAVASFSAPMGA